MKSTKILAVSAMLVLVLAGLLMSHAADTTKPAAKPYQLDTCAVCGMKLGEMGKPYVFTYKDREIKVCEKSEEKEFLKDPAKYVKEIETAEAKLKK